MYPLKRIVPSLRNINIFKSTFYPPLKLLKNLIIKSYYKIISFKFTPYCNKTLEKNKIRKDFNIYKCKNNYCYFYQYNFAKMIKDAKKLFKTKPFKFKFRYTYLEFKCDIIPLSKKSPVIPKVDLSKIYFSPHTLGKTILYSEWYPF